MHANAPLSNTGPIENAAPIANAVPGFLPSTRGLRFANRFPPGPTVRLGPIDPRWIGIGDASAGLCGGMSWLVCEQFAAGLPVPVDSEAPPNGSPLFAAIVRRQVLSLDWLRVPFRIWSMAASGPKRAARATIEREWPRVRREIDAGRPAMVAVVRRAGCSPFALTMNHQVLAYGYTIDAGGVSLRVYDPNWPMRDDVEVRIPTRGATGDRASQSTGEPLIGFIHAPIGGAGSG